MAQEQYSPTVANLYATDSQWWSKNGGGRMVNDRPSVYDNEGYNYLGYNIDGKDRAGKTQIDYIEFISLDADWGEESKLI